MLQDTANYLDKGQRKQVFTKRFYSVKDINDNLLRAYLLEAVEIDELLFREKGRRKKR